jgi:hypothetical protein
MLREGDAITFVCNACGAPVPCDNQMGQRWRCCSMECVLEMEWRDALRLTGKTRYELRKERGGQGASSK